MRNTMNIGKAIEVIREEKKLKQADLARLLGVARGTINNYEAGTNAPSLAALERIAAALGVKVYQLVAKAEGYEPIIRVETQEEADTRKVMESLDAQQRYKLAAIAAILKSDE